MKTIHLLVLMVLTTQLTWSQSSDSTPIKKTALQISGSVDGYYRFDFNQPSSSPYNNLTSFTKTQNSFELGMASIKAEHHFGKASALIDLGFGKRAEEFSYNDANTRFALKQLLVRYAPSSKLQLTLGTWDTHIGYEMVDPQLNRNYSMSYLFSNGPFTHTGLKAEFQIGKRSTVTLGISNPIDQRSASGFSKTFLAQYATSSNNDRFKIYLNFAGGDQSDNKRLLQEDVVFTYQISKQFQLGGNATWQSLRITNDSSHAGQTLNWGGLAVYLNYDPVKWVGLTLRTEYLNDEDGYLGIQHAFETTLSANFKIDQLTIIPEFRFDETGKALFERKNEANKQFTASFLLAVCYTF